MTRRMERNAFTQVSLGDRTQARPIRVKSTTPLLAEGEAEGESRDLTPSGSEARQCRSGRRPERSSCQLAERGQAKSTTPLLAEGEQMAGWTGLEPAASGVTGRRYNQLNYHPIG